MKSHNAFELTWGVQIAGYRWNRLEDEDDRHRHHHMLVPGAGGIRYTEPLGENAGLFRDFAALEPTSEGILRFAHRYGELGLRSDPEDFEFLEQWVELIREMRELTTLWDSIEKGDLETLGQSIRWQSDGSAVEIHVPDGQGKSTWKSMPADGLLELLPRNLHREDLIGPARIYLKKRLNLRLSGRFTVKLVEDSPDGSLGIAIIPDSLIAGIWLQFAQAIEGNKQFRQCQVCGRWFELSSRAKRATAKFCSDGCRFKAYRQRKTRATELAEEGVPPTEIAVSLDTTVAQVRKWTRRQ